MHLRRAQPWCQKLRGCLSHAAHSHEKKHQILQQDESGPRLWKTVNKGLNMLFSGIIIHAGLLQFSRSSGYTSAYKIGSLRSQPLRFEIPANRKGLQNLINIAQKMCMHTNPTLSESRAAVVQSVTLSPLYCLHTNLTQLSFSQLISALLRQQIRLFAAMVDCTSEWWWNCDAVSASPTLLNVRAAAQYCLPPGTRSTERKKGVRVARQSACQPGLASMCSHVCRLAAEWRRN